MANLKDVTDADFQSEVLEADQPVLVDFWAPWCGPCRQLTPTIEELAGDYEGKAKVVKVNVDDSRQTAMSYQVMNIPTVVLFKGGEPVQRWNMAPKAQYAEAIDAAL